MIIIVEGIDRIGKSTLCKKLSEKLNAVNYRDVYKKQVDYKNFAYAEFTFNNLDDIRSCKAENVYVFDRLHLSEYVFSIVDRHYKENDAKFMFETVESFLKNAILIYMRPTDVKKSSEEDGRDLSIYLDKFEEIFKQSKIQTKLVCKYNEIDETIEKVKDLICK